MGNMIIGWPNAVQRNTVTFAGGNWSEDAPLTNLRDDMLTRVARVASGSNALVDTQFTATLSGQYPDEYSAVQMVAIPSHTLLPSAKIRVRGYLNVSTLQYDSGWLTPWTGITSYMQSQLYGGKMNFVHVLPSPVNAETWKIEVDHTAAANPRIEIGGLFIGGIFQPSVNADYGCSIKLETATSSEDTRGGATFFDERPVRRIMDFSLSNLTAAEQLLVMRMQRLANLNRSVMFVFDPADTGELLLQRAFLATLKELSGLEYVDYNKTSTGFRMREVLATGNTDSWADNWNGFELDGNGDLMPLP